jgi:hypothetical protein
MLTESPRPRADVPNTESDGFANLEVVFSDLSESEQPEWSVCSLGDWQRQASDAANDYIFLLNCEVIDLWQRNTNASFSLLRKMTEAKSLVKIVELQTAHFSNQFAALARQNEELTILSLKATGAFLRRLYWPNAKLDFALA